MFSKSLLSIALLVLAATANAALTFDKSVTVADGQGGQYAAHTTGSRGGETSARLSEATFTAFHPGADRPATVDGFINREANRDGDVADVSYDGNLTLANLGNDPAGTPRPAITIQFTDLLVHRGEEGVTLEGTVIVNGTSFDANAAPRVVRGIVVRLIGLFAL